MSKLSYFAYGSNMSSRRLQARVPSARAIGMAMLTGHRLVFHKPGRTDGSGKCDVVKSDAGEVWGVIFDIDVAEKLNLDRLEGLNHGYAEKTVTVTLKSGVRMDAVTYFAIKTDPNLKPFSWYKRHVLEGAREARLPHGYIEFLEQTSAMEDYNKEREAEELSIYS